MILPALSADASSGDAVALCSPAALDRNGPAFCRAPESPSADLMIVRPKGGGDLRPPLVYLLGGAGLYPDRQFPRFLDMANRWNRPVLVAVQPGLGPEERRTLDCPDALTPRLWQPADSPQAAPLMPTDPAPPVDACLAYLGSLKGRVGAYSSDTAAARLTAALKALDSGPVDVIAESYGARLAYRLAEGAPTLVRALVLDSPETLWEESFYHTGRNLAAALDTLSEACGDVRKCPTRGRRMSEKLVARLTGFDQGAAPAMRLRDQESGAVLGYVRPAPVHLALRLIPALASPQEAGFLPFITASGSDTDLQRRFAPLISGYVLDDSPALSFTLHHLIRCSEWPLERWYKAMAEDGGRQPSLRPMLDYLIARQRHICRALDLEGPETAMPPQLTVPTLLLSGTLDPVTPSGTVERAFRGMEGVSRLAYGMAGHVVQLAAPCVLGDIDAYFKAPGKAPVTGCTREDLKIPFYQPIAVR